MSVVRHEIVRWFTTPRELREIADDMERRWPTLRLGQSKIITARWQGDTCLEIAVDQERIDKC